MGDFASYLHNSYAYPSKEESAAINVFVSKIHFNSGYNINQELEKVLSEFFSDKNKKLHTKGINHFQKLLKEKVIREHLIGLILYGSNIDDRNNKHLMTYITADLDKIELDIKNVCRFLLKDHFSYKEIEKYARETPSFYDFYKNEAGETAHKFY